MQLIPGQPAPGESFITDVFIYLIIVALFTNFP